MRGVHTAVGALLLVFCAMGCGRAPSPFLSSEAIPTTPVAAREPSRDGGGRPDHVFVTSDGRSIVAVRAVNHPVNLDVTTTRAGSNASDVSPTHAERSSLSPALRRVLLSVHAEERAAPELTSDE